MRKNILLILFTIFNATLVSGQPACPYEPIPMAITSDITWNTNLNIESDVVVSSGSTLTINSQGFIHFPTDAKIIIHPGGKLILNGGTLTNACYDLWGGIEVWGDPEATQIPTNQGWLSISNGGTIENAVVAVRVGAEDYAFKGGGIVSATEAVFHNNRSGVIYHNYEDSNIGNFTISTFETTDELLDASTPIDHIRLISVEGITVNGCIFRNTRNSSVEYSNRGNGITCMDASFYVDHKCISETTPCTSYQETTFDSLYYGVKAMNFFASVSPTIKNSLFKKNFRGAYISGITWAVVDSCSFEVNTPFVTNGGYGLYLDNSTGYTIEENNFYSSMASPTGIGVIVHNSGTAANEIYRNWFTNLDQGISAQELNRNPFLSQGLQILCCEFETCNFDILVPRPTIASRGIAPHQGANTLNAEDMAGNLFDIHGLIPDGDFDDINNQGSYINYYYPTNNDDYRVKPIDYTTNTVNRVGIYVIDHDWYFETDCPVSTSGGSPEESLLVSNLNEANEEIDSIEQSLAILVDGGDTEMLFQEVDNSSPPEVMDLYNELMNATPYLSDTVVGATIEKEDVIPGAMLRDVMVANPHSAKSEKLMEKLDERYTPLPEYMKAQILEIRSQVSMKEELESKLAKHRLEKKRAFSGLVHHFTDSDSITGWRDSIASLLANDNDLHPKYRLALWQLHNREFTQSVNTMNSIPGMFDLQGGGVLSGYNDMLALHGILTEILSSDSNWHTIGTSKVQQLTDLSQASAPASVYARNILIMTGNMTYSEPIQIPDMSKSSEAESTLGKVLKAQGPSKLDIYPNPASGYFVIGYHLDNLLDATIEIHNTKGELVENITLVQNKDQQVINTEGWQSGIYVITLTQEGKVIESAKLTLVN
jgi:hypothetical protein